jgi:formylglycine-generating enzyme required for sulfatase activity
MKKLGAAFLFFTGFCFASIYLQAQTPANLALQFSNGVVQLIISGTVSNSCTIQSATNLLTVNPWQYQSTIQLASNPQTFSDTNQTTGCARFYRIFTQELPTNVIPAANMIWISPGSFVMGSPTNEALRNSDETQHAVTLTHGFFIGKYPVTQSNYLALIGTNPSFFTTNNGYNDNPNRPVESVSWNDATNYCALLTQQEISAGRLSEGWSYRLPTESEWECACRAGTSTAVYYGNELKSGMANFDGRFEYDYVTGTINNPPGIYLEQTTTVGSYQSNAWGLYDECGNVYEWCQDWYGTYPTGNVSDPQGVVSGSYRVFRGGSWSDEGQFCRSAQRGEAAEDSTFGSLGFRIVLAPN